MKVVKVFSPTCGPCKVLEKNLKEAGINYTDADISTDFGASIAEEHGVRNVPTLLLLDRDGKLVSSLGGIQSVEKLKELKETLNETD